MEASDAEGDKLFEQSYVLESDGQRDEVVEKRYDGTSATPFSTVKIDWSYDALNRLVGETSDVGNDGPGDGDYQDDYSFDLVGNRLKKAHDAGNDGLGGVGDEVLTSLYDANDRLQSVTSDQSGPTSYSYDANGSTTSQTSASQTIRYEWDLRNRMTGVDANNDGDTTDVGDATYLYDQEGSRIEKAERVNVDGVIQEVLTHYLQETNNPTGYSQVLEETVTQADGSTARTSYLIGQDVIGQSDASGVRFFLYDGHGSTRALLSLSPDAQGNWVVQSYDYDAYGNAHGFDPALAETKLLYSGELFDEVLGQYMLRARNYTPSIGRFSSFDPIDPEEIDPASPVNLHKYLYGNGNPVMNWDPTGLTSEGEQLTVSWVSQTLQSISLQATKFVARAVPARLAAAFATGATAIGQAWNWLGRQVSDIAVQVMGLFPQLQRFPQTLIGQRIIDFTLKASNKVANLEIKYSLPSRAGDALNRLVGQMSAMVTRVPYGEEAVVWTLKEPTMAAMQRLQQAAGLNVFNQVRFVHGVTGLYQWIRLYFNL